jgi:DNA polymerase III subunit chi
MADGGGAGLTRVDFYVTPNSESLARERLACRIAEKAFRLGHRLHVHLADETSLDTFDGLLWTFRDVSFLPHARPGADDAVRITLDTQAVPEPVPDLLINLSAEIPGFFSRFERVAEIVSGDPSVRETGREHFRFYRDRGYPLQHHEV